MGRLDRNRMAELQNAIDLQGRGGPATTQRILLRIYDGGAIPATVPKVFFGHPANMNADATEGASYTTGDDTTTSIPVVVIGPRIPVAGDLIVAHAIGGRWVAGESGSPSMGDPVCVLLFNSGRCGVYSGHHLTFSVNATFAGATSWPMTWTGSVWNTPTMTTTDSLGRTQMGQFLFLPYDSAHGGATIIEQFTISSGSAARSTDDSCNPLHFHHHITPGPGSFSTQLLQFYGVTDIYVDDSDTSVTSSCDVLVTVLGCNNLPLSGAGVAMNLGGGTIDSGTTDAAGHWSFPSSHTGSFPPTYHLVTTKSRFGTDTSSFSNFDYPLDLVPTITLGAASGYNCFVNCAIPLSNSLTITFAIAGAKTLTYSGGSWGVSFSANDSDGNPHAYVVALSATAIFSLTRDGVTCSGLSFAVTSCPPAFTATVGIGAGACADEVGASATVSE